MLKLRMSYSLIASWMRGEYENAANFYLHKYTPTNQGMNEGKEWDEKLSDLIDKEKKLPPEFGSIEFIKPETHKKLVVPFNDVCDLVAEIDCLDLPIIYEFKTGTLSSGHYALTYQLPMYFLITKLAGMDITSGKIIRYNQHENETDWTLLWNTEAIQEKARNCVETLLPEIYQYFETNGILLQREVMLAQGKEPIARSSDTIQESSSSTF